ncbi:Auxin-responsive protein IAA14 [Zea mays]|uniref:Auxin-responsive protein IAA14 n=1 Tax=Zea mays TaxID=4577 RepID=A0A1D6MVX4_MAIZE|nr:Auxin-responsive protein IAA14 [Zea mays]
MKRSPSQSSVAAAAAAVLADPAEKPRAAKYVVVLSCLLSTVLALALFRTYVHICLAVNRLHSMMHIYAPRASSHESLCSSLSVCS